MVHAGWMTTSRLRRFTGASRSPAWLGYGWLALLFAFVCSVTSASGAEVGAVPPVSPPLQVTRPFAPPDAPWLSGHRGVDLLAPPGTPVVSPLDGVVLYAAMLADRPVVSVLHASGIRTTYEPVEASVNVGQQVFAGEPLGTVVAGHEGGSLHWGARWAANEYVDPLTLLGMVPVLKQWD